MPVLMADIVNYDIKYESIMYKADKNIQNSKKRFLHFITEQRIALTK